MREQQFSDPIALFQVRVAGKDEGVDAEIGVLPDPCRHGRAVAHQRGASAAANQADAGPEVRRHHQAVAPPAMQRSHALLAHRIEARQGGLGASDGVVVQVTDQPVGGGPGFCIRFPHDHMQTDAEAHRSAMPGRLLAHLGDLLGHGFQRLAPGQVQVYLLPGQLVRGVG